MKKVISIVVAICLIGISLAFFVTTGQADTQKNTMEVSEEALSVAKDAVYFGEMIRFGYSDIVHMKFGKIAPMLSYKDLLPWAEEKGYLPDEYEGKLVPLKNCVGEDAGWNHSMWAYADRFTTVDQMKKELKRYFLYDFCELISCGGHAEDDRFQTCVNHNIQEYQGRVYGNAELVDLSYLPIWETARLGSIDANSAQLIVSVADHSEEETILLTKTSEGWRVSGGSYFEMRYDISIPPVPPKTGDPTAAYALIFTLAALPLAVFGVAEWKRRRRAV
jgi:hypothetical protein